MQFHYGQIFVNTRLYHVYSKWPLLAGQLSAGHIIKTTSNMFTHYTETSNLALAYQQTQDNKTKWRINSSNFLQKCERDKIVFLFSEKCEWQNALSFFFLKNMKVTKCTVLLSSDPFYNYSVTPFCETTQLLPTKPPHNPKIMAQIFITTKHWPVPCSYLC